MIPHNKLTDGEPLAREKFFSPAREFGIMPFWFWNGEMDLSLIHILRTRWWNGNI